MKSMTDRNDKMSFPVMFQKIDDYTEDDKRITKVKIWLMHLGKNANGSIFNKEVVDKAIPTLAYCPIVGFIENNNDKDDFTGHKFVVTTKEKDGKLIKCTEYKGEAYGVILSQEENNAHYEERACDDGETRTFLVVDGIMWNMFEDATSIMQRDLIKSHSMELYQGDENCCQGYEDEDGYFVFTDFSFRAACILGSGFEPAMINSTVEVQFTLSNFVKSIQSKLNDEYTTYTKIMKKKGKESVKDMEDKNFTQTVREQLEDIQNIVSNQEEITTDWGDKLPRFYTVDIQDNEVIVIDRKNFGYYGLSFTVTGDKPEINFDKPQRKKIRFEDYVNADDNEIQADNFSIVNCDLKQSMRVKKDFVKVTKEKEEIEAKFTKLDKEYQEIKEKYEKYVKAEIDAKKDEMFSRFEKELCDNEDFMSLKQNRDSFSPEEIEEKCSVLFTRKKLYSNFNKTKDNSLVVNITNSNNDDCKFIKTKYGNIPVGR